MKSSLPRATLFGLGAGMLLGAFMLVVFAYQGYRLECPELPSSECHLRQDTAAELAGLQTLAALGLGLGAAASFLLLRSAAKPPTPTSR